MSAFTQYWSQATLRAVIPGRLTDTAGSQFGDVRPGDRVYVLSSRHGRVQLVGRMIAAAIGDHIPGADPSRAVFSKREAAKALDYDPRKLFPAKQHLIAEPGSAEDMRFDLWLTATDLRRLRFEGEHPTLDVVTSGRLRTHQQIRSVRKLIPASARLLDGLFRRPKAVEVITKPLASQPKRTSTYEIMRQQRKLEQWEDELVRSYKSFVKSRWPNSRVVQKQFQIAGIPYPLFCDMFVEDWNLLIEAKADTDRASIRMAIGQLADYRRLFRQRRPRKAILVPEKPNDDLLELLGREHISVIWRSSTRTFSDTAKGAFT